MEVEEKNEAASESAKKSLREDILFFHPKDKVLEG